MAGDTDNPRIWLNGDVYVADVGTTAPTTPTQDLTALGFDAVGLLSEDGLTENREQESKDHYAWGSIHVRTTRSKHKRTFKFAMLEATALTFGLINPGSTSAYSGGNTTRTVKIPTPDPRSFIFKVVDGDITSLLVIPEGEIDDVAEITRAENEMTKFEVTVVVYSDENGVLYYEITDDPGADDGS